MGTVTSLAAHRRVRDAARGPAPAARHLRAVFSFDLGSPFTYLAAERVDRLFANVVWQPTLADVLGGPPLTPALAEARAAALGLPLIWPDAPAASVRPAMRVASLAAERGVGAPFVLAASRLAFCGGFELDDPETLAEAAAAAGLGLDESLEAAHDTARDAPMEHAGRWLAEHGADRLPVLRVGRTLFAGEERVGEAAAAAQALTVRAG